MTREEACMKKDDAIKHFPHEGKLLGYDLYGNGHINDTFLLEYELCDGVILQRMNHEIFKKPIELMENILGVTSFLKEKIIENGGDPERETLNVITSDEGLPYYQDVDGNYWRAYRFIEGATSFDTVENPVEMMKDEHSVEGERFAKIAELTNDYHVPADACRTYQVTYKMLEDFQAFDAGMDKEKYNKLYETLKASVSK